MSGGKQKQRSTGGKGSVEWTSPTSSARPSSRRPALAFLLPGLVLWACGVALWLAAGNAAFALGKDMATWYPLLALIGVVGLSSLAVSPLAASRSAQVILKLLLSISLVPAAGLGALVEALATRSLLGLITGAIAGGLLCLSIRTAGRVSAVLIEGHAARAAGRAPHPLRASWRGMAASVAVAGAFAFLALRLRSGPAAAVPFAAVSPVVLGGLAITRFLRNIRQARAALLRARGGRR